MATVGEVLTFFEGRAEQLFKTIEKVENRLDEMSKRTYEFNVKFPEQFFPINELKAAIAAMEKAIDGFSKSIEASTKQIVGATEETAKKVVKTSESTASRIAEQTTSTVDNVTARAATGISAAILTFPIKRLLTTKTLQAGSTLSQFWDFVVGKARLARTTIRAFGDIATESLPTMDRIVASLRFAKGVSIGSFIGLFAFPVLLREVLTLVGRLRGQGTAALTPIEKSVGIINFYFKQLQTGIFTMWRASAGLIAAVTPFFVSTTTVLAFLPAAINSVVGVVTSAIQKTFTIIAAKFGSGKALLSIGITQLKAFVATASGGFLSFAQGFINAQKNAKNAAKEVKKLGDFASPAAKALANTKLPIGVQIQALVATIKPLLSDILLQMNKIFLLMARVFNVSKTDLAEIGMAAEKNLKTVETSATRAGQSITELASKGKFTRFREGIVSLTKGITSPILSLPGQIRGVARFLQTPINIPKIPLPSFPGISAAQKKFAAIEEFQKKRTSVSNPADAALQAYYEKIIKISISIPSFISANKKSGEEFQKQSKIIANLQRATVDYISSLKKLANGEEVKSFGRIYNLVLTNISKLQGEKLSAKELKKSSFKNVLSQEDAQKIIADIEGAIGAESSSKRFAEKFFTMFRKELSGSSKKSQGQMKQIFQQFLEVPLNNAFPGLRASGAQIPAQIAAGIKQNLQAMDKAGREQVEEVDKYLTHSPAKYGPLKNLSASGQEIVNQLAEGMTKGIQFILPGVMGKWAGAIIGKVRGIIDSVTSLTNGVIEKIAPAADISLRAERLGVSIPVLSALGAAFGKVGGTIDDAEFSLVSMQNSLNRGFDDETGKFIKNVGIDIEKIKKTTNPAVSALYALSGAVNNGIVPGTQKFTKLLEAFSLSPQSKVVNVLVRDAKALAEEAVNAGLVINESFAKNAEKVTEIDRKIGALRDSFTNTFLETVLPGVEDALNAVADFFSKNNDRIKLFAAVVGDLFSKLVTLSGRVAKGLIERPKETFLNIAKTLVAAIKLAIDTIITLVSPAIKKVRPYIEAFGTFEKDYFIGATKDILTFVFYFVPQKINELMALIVGKIIDGVYEIINSIGPNAPDFLLKPLTATFKALLLAEKGLKANAASLKAVGEAAVESQAAIDAFHAKIETLSASPTTIDLLPPETLKTMEDNLDKFLGTIKTSVTDPELLKAIEDLLAVFSQENLDRLKSRLSAVKQEAKTELDKVEKPPEIPVEEEKKLNPLLDRVTNGLGDAFSSALTKFGEEGKLTMESIAEIGKQQFSAIFSQTVGDLKTALQENLTSVFKSLGAESQKLVGGALTGIFAAGMLLLSRIKNTTSQTFEGITNNIETVQEKVRGIIAGDVQFSLQSVVTSFSSAQVPVAVRLDTLIGIGREIVAIMQNSAQVKGGTGFNLSY